MDDSVPYVPIESVAKHFAVSISTVRAWVRLGYIPKSAYLKISNTYRFSLPAIVAALTSVPDNEVVQKTPAVNNAAPAAPVQLELNFNPDQDL
jgi:hypothetical protein